jgi:hypothetical protein
LDIDPSDEYLACGSGTNIMIIKLKKDAVPVEEIADDTLQVLFPNPTSGIVTLNNLNINNYLIKLTDLSGREILIKDKISINENDISIDLISLHSGIYFFSLSDKNHYKTYKIIKN